MPKRGPAGVGDPAVLTAVAAALAGIRGAKSQAKVSMRATAPRAEVSGPAAAGRGRRRRPPTTCVGAGHVTGDLVFSPVAAATEITRGRGAGRPARLNTDSSAGCCDFLRWRMQTNRCRPGTCG